MDLLWTIAVILAILWLLGLVTSYTLGGFIHILLVLAIIVVLIRVIQGRRPVYVSGGVTCAPLGGQALSAVDFVHAWLRPCVDL